MLMGVERTRRLTWTPGSYYPQPGLEFSKQVASRVSIIVASSQQNEITPTVEGPTRKEGYTPRSSSVTTKLKTESPRCSSLIGISDSDAEKGSDGDERAAER